MQKLIVFSVFFLMVVHSNAGTDPKALKILTHVDKKYTQYKSLKIEFDLETKAAESKPKIEKGSFVYQGDAFKMILPQQEIYFNGSVQWTYLVSQKEVQISKIESAENPFHPKYLVKLYKSDQYEYQLISTSKTEAVFDFKPLDRKESVFKIKLYINTTTNQITKVQWFEKNGSNSTIKVKSNTVNAKIPNSDFEMKTDQLKGIHIEDLREE